MKFLKRFLPLLLCLCLLMVTACGAESRSSVYEKDGFVIDTDNRTITHGEDVYTYTLSGGSSSTFVEFTYPNGATYSWTKQGNMSHGSWSDDYDPERYVEGGDLIDLLELEAPRRSRGSPLAALLLLVIGLADAIFPRAAWYLSCGWRFRNAEPSDAALVLGRVSGVILILAGVILFFV